MLRGDGITNRTRPCADVGGSDREKTPAGKHPALDVRQERIAGGAQALGTLRSVDSRYEHLGDERLPRRRDRRQLQVLFRAEVRVEPALAHPDRRCEAADGKAFEPVDRRKARGLHKD